ncbi:hypothetical protein L2E82_36890 [Cichorium intybus]|uniref:Uncharacterized protein n=1 Tax=Cichorium intybus TaxID=13427 RepID=A0ACB9AD70_CICIN|nr:hypothetical protein L2E82_36890 [Cichorium intybus]
MEHTISNNDENVAIGYMDKPWKGKSQLLPFDPYLRSQATFWVDHTDKACGGLTTPPGQRCRTISYFNQLTDSVQLILYFFNLPTSTYSDLFNFKAY